MKLTIKLKQKKVPLKIHIWLPLFFAKSKIIWKIAINSSEEKKEIIKAKKLTINIYKYLKQIVKENGHFTLIEIDNPEVYIKIKV